jgi:tetratricopeptide (TPR) repeat protein
MRRKLLGERHPDVATSLNSLAVLLMKFGESKKARDHYELALAILIEQHGPRHKSVGVAISNLAILLAKSGKLEEAREYHERALEIKIELLGEKHKTVAESHTNLGYLFKKLGNLDKAVTSAKSTLYPNRDSWEYPQICSYSTH